MSARPASVQQKTALHVLLAPSRFWSGAGKFCAEAKQISTAVLYLLPTLLRCDPQLTHQLSAAIHKVCALQNVLWAKQLLVARAQT